METILFTFILISAILFFFRSFSRTTQIFKISKPEDRSYNKLQRIKNTISIALLQSKLFKKKFAGILHALIFWGFLVLLLVIIEDFLEAYINNFSFSFTGKFYNLITITQDLFSLTVTVAVLISLFRRYIFTPSRLKTERESKIDAAIILVWIFLIMITTFGSNIERIKLNTSEGIRPISEFLARIISGDGSYEMYKIYWWCHNILILGFLNYLPYSKHFHIISSVPNTFFSNYRIEPKNVINPLNLEDETVQHFGIKDIKDFTWKGLLDSYTCTECGRCTEACPANKTGKKLNPKLIITNTRKRISDSAMFFINKEETNPIYKKSLVPNYTTQEELWACTTCGACTEECPVMIEHLNYITGMRMYLTMMESDFPSELNTLYKNLENNGSPWAFDPEERNRWITEFILECETERIRSSLIKLSEPEGKDKIEIIYWVGCAGALDTRYVNVTKSFAKILSKAGVRFGVLGNEEKCNGDTARRLGNEYLAQEFIKANIETFKKYSIKKIVTTCPHCYNSLKNEYPKFGIDLEVYHHSEYINKLLNERKFIPKTSGKITEIAFHDSCYTGRYNDIYREPRNILESCNIKIREPRRNRKNGFCCGAGGGRLFMEEKAGKRINIERTEELIDTNVSTIATVCPFCMTMITDGIKDKGMQERVEIKDISEILNEFL